jgi:hypothetical protein
MSDTPNWLDEPEEHDYAAAYDYLSLLFPPKGVQTIVAKLNAEKHLFWWKAKDIIRASQERLLHEDDKSVAKDLKKVEHGEKLSPILLVGVDGLGYLTIADGYHRACAAYELDENTSVPAKLVYVSMEELS